MGGPIFLNGFFAGVAIMVVLVSVVAIGISAAQRAEKNKEESKKDKNQDADPYALTTVNAKFDCKVLRKVVAEGSFVNAGDDVVIVERLKMELTETAPMSGKVHYYVNALDCINEGDLLYSIM